MASDYNRPVFDQKRMEMSEFMANELLYDYLFDRLDEERKQDVAKILEESEQSQKEFEKLEAGRDYCQSLAQCSVSESLLDDLRESQSLGRQVLRALDPREWPAPVRWSLEGLVVAVLVGLIVAKLPLSSFFTTKPETSLILAEHGAERIQGEVETTQPDKAPESEPSTAVVVADEEKKLETKPLAKKEEPPKALSETREASQPQVQAQPEVKPQDQVKPEKKVADVSVVSATPTPVPTPSASGQGNAFVYRLYMYRKGVDQIAAQVVADIEALGGEKAGEVELGWKKANGRYFHFQMGDDQHEKLLESLKSYGSIRVRRSKHSRVMPAGIFRYIFWMEER